VGFGREARHVAYPVPMILAANIGPMPKISVRVVPQASTSASMRSFRPAIFLSSVRILSAGPPKPVGAGRARRSPAVVCRAGCALPGRRRAFRLSRRGRDLAGVRAGCLEPPCAFGHQVNKRLSESRRSISDAVSGSTAASRSLREAAKAVARASRPSFLRELPVDSTRTFAESLGGTSTTDSPAAANLPARYRPRGRRRSPALRATLGEPLRPALEGSQAGAVLREGSTLEELAFGFVDRRYGDRRLVGIDPY
jgi:hypothetical protein